MSSINPERTPDPISTPSVSKPEASPPSSQGPVQSTSQENISSVVSPIIGNIGKEQADNNYLSDSVEQGGIKEQVLQKGKGSGDAVKFLQDPANKKHDFVVYYSGSAKSWAVMFQDKIGKAFPFNNPKTTIKEQIPAVKMKIIEEREKQYKSLQASISAGINPFGPAGEPSKLEGTIYKDAAKVLAKSSTQPVHRDLEVNSTFFKKMLKSLKVSSSEEEAGKRLGSHQSKDKQLFWIKDNEVFVMFKDQNGTPYRLSESESYEKQIQDIPQSAEYAANGKAADDELLSSD